MVTVLDAFVIELGLDPKKLNEGQRQAVDSFKKTQNEAVKSAKAIEAAADKISDTFSSATRSALGFFAALAGFRTLDDFIGNLVKADAALGRLSTNMGIAPQTISAWGQITEQFGGSLQGFESTLQRVQKMLYDNRYGVAQLPSAFQRLATGAQMRIDYSGNAIRTLTQELTALQKIHDNPALGGPLKAHGLAQELGIDPALENAAYSLGPGITKYVQEIQNSLTPTNEAIKNAQELQRAYAQLSQAVTNLLDNGFRAIEPVLTPIIKDMNEWVLQNKDWIDSKIVQGVQDFKGALPEIRDDLKWIADHFNEIKTASEAIVAIWAGSKILGVVGNLRAALGGAAPAAGGGGGLWAALGVYGMAGGGVNALINPGEGLKNAPRKYGAWGVDDVIRWMLGTDKSAPTAKLKDASGHADALQNNPALGASMLGNGRDAALDAFLNGDTKVDGRPVSKANPMPVTLTNQASGGSGSWWDTLKSWFTGGSSGTANGGSVASFVGKTLAAGTPSLTGTNADIVAYIRQAAIKRGIDPNIALRVAGHEGLRGFDPTKVDRGGDGGSSFGPFQLHYGGINPQMPHGGLGDEFTKQTGLDARNSNTWKQQIDFALDQVRKGGWAPWMGARAEGIFGKMGVGPLPNNGYVDSVMSGASLSSHLSSITNNVTNSTSSSRPVNVTIGDVHVNAPNATDARGISSNISATLQQMVAAQLVSEGQN
ncbi:hypothetical protein QA646_17825 [Rhizobium sp. CB3090]|uniref:hypothetical protein n=1 Tax=Rhizobium sp. CB3090 TaxID=3039156 RepID=UPI0024B26C5E|nr:hypothetical protein [Rhizobium sp. CB3090]WFU09105.1 hypothetical protein QA646_17825 [Rhizobium sp. CB3090]